MGIGTDTTVTIGLLIVMLSSAAWVTKIYMRSISNSAAVVKLETTMKDLQKNLHDEIEHLREDMNKKDLKNAERWGRVEEKIESIPKIDNKLDTVIMHIINGKKP